MGFGLKELKLLRHTITEIAVANDIPSDEAIEKFFEDIYKQYDDKIGFESRLDKVRAEVNRLTQEESRLRYQLLTLPLVSPSLIRLLQKGVSEQDIIDIAGLLENSDGNDSKGSNGDGITTQEIRLLISEFRSYGSIKLAVKQLGQKAGKLRSQISSLQAEKQDSYIQYQKMSSILQNLGYMVSFFSGSSLSIRNEIMGLMSTVAYTMYSFNDEKIRLQKLQKLPDRDSLPLDSEFMSLAMAARGEVVDLKKLKVALIKSIEVLQERLNSNTKLKEMLYSVRLALLDEQL